MSIDTEIRRIHQAVNLEGFIHWLEEFTQRSIEQDEPFPSLVIPLYESESLKGLDQRTKEAFELIHQQEIRKAREAYKSQAQSAIKTKQEQAIQFYIESMKKGLQIFNPERDITARRYDQFLFTTENMYQLIDFYSKEIKPFWSRFKKKRKLGTTELLTNERFCVNEKHSKIYTQIQPLYLELKPLAIHISEDDSHEISIVHQAIKPYFSQRFDPLIAMLL